MINGIISVLNNDYQISLPPSKVPTYNGGWSYIKTAGVGMVFRQVLNKMKKKGMLSFDKLWIKTSVYSMGNNMNIYLHNPTKETYEIVKNLCWEFSTGSFNGMIDLYENTPSELRLKLKLTNGEELDCSSKWVNCYDSPPFGSKEYEQESK